MPTYHCHIPYGLLDAKKRARLASAICRCHNEATGAPVHFVQVVIDENQHSTRYLGNQEAVEPYLDSW